MNKMKMLGSLILCMVIILSITFTGCSKSESQEPTSESSSAKSDDSDQKAGDSSKDSDKVYKLKLGVMVNKDQAQSKGAMYFAEKVEEATNGKVIVDVFTDGVLGSEQDMWEGISAGTLDMCVNSPGNIGNFVPEYQIFDLPFLFRSREHRDKVAASAVEQKMNQMLEDKAGMIVLGQFGGTGRVLITRDKKVEKLDDVNGIKMRVYPSPIVVDTWTALGTIPVTVAYAEAYTALQTGVVDAAENETATLITQKWYEPCKYVTLTEHNINMRPLVIGKSQLEILPKEYQDILKKVGKEAADYAVKCEREDDVKYLEELKNLNIEIIELQDKDKWIDATKQLRTDFVGKYGIEDMLSEIEAVE